MIVLTIFNSLRIIRTLNIVILNVQKNNYFTVLD